MRYLLDTHVLIWYFDDPSRLSSEVEKIIDNSENHIFISSVSFWEIAIKTNSGKLRLNLSLDQLLDDIANGDFNIVQIENEYLKRLAGLPFIHKDPFDRMLISTALAEKLTLITVDENIRKYDVAWAW